MFRQFQFDNTAFPSAKRANSFVERVATHHTMSALHSSHDVVDTIDAFGAFGAFDVSFDDDMELRLFEYLYDAGSRPSNTVDESVDNGATNNDYTKGSHNTPSSSTSCTLPLPPPHPFNSPVELCYWANLGLVSPPRVSSSETAVEGCDERGSSSSSVAKPDPFLVRSDLALGELQVAENPFFAKPLPSMEDAQGDEKVVSDEEVHLCPSPLAVSNSSESTRADTPFPRTPSTEPCEASGTIPRRIEAAGSSVGAPASPNGLLDVGPLLDRKTSPSECAPGDTSPEVKEEDLEEVFPAADAELVAPALTSDTSSLTRANTAAAPEDSAPVPKEEPVVLEVTPNVPSPSLSGSTNAQGPHALPVSQDTPPSRKRKRVAKAHAAHELRALSTLPPERKKFSLPVRAGRASKTGTNKVRNIQLESESCCHLAGNDGFCQFRVSADGRRKCMAELPKDDKAARAHLATHTDALGWREYSRRHPDWKPTCPWCNESRTKFEQLTRHILDTHLLMFMEWCPCGGTNSRSNHKPNTVRHIYSDVHKAYLQQQADLRAIKKEDADDGQEEFVQGSSKGTKRRRRG